MSQELGSQDSERSGNSSEYKFSTDEDYNPEDTSENNETETESENENESEEEPMTYLRRDTIKLVPDPAKEMKTYAQILEQQVERYKISRGMNKPIGFELKELENPKARDLLFEEWGKIQFFKELSVMLKKIQSVVDI